MKNSNLFKIILGTLALVGLQSCVDPYHLESANFEEVLVVEGTLTNELKPQKIKISKSYRLEENGTQKVSDAVVFVTDDNGNQFDFHFTPSDSLYTSVNNFAAATGVSYILNINQGGKLYLSTPEKLTTVTPIEELTTSVITKNNGDIGIKIGTNSFDPSRTSNYYRYEYQETYKIVAPFWSSFDLNYTVTDQFFLTDRPGITDICYPTLFSSSIILNSTSNLSEDRVSDLEVNFINKQDYKIAHKYSILVKQYVQNLAAHTFYSTLKEISSAGGVLSQNQPGFFSGNMRSMLSEDEKVVGFFEVSSVSEKRIFLKYSDFFSGSPTPYAYDCVIMTYDISTNEGFEALRDGALSGGIKYYNHENNVYNMSSHVCADCTLITTTTTPPAFWE